MFELPAGSGSGAGRLPAARRHGVALLVALVTAILAAGPAAAAGEPLPECTYRDVITRYTAYSEWDHTLLDTILKVTRNYDPPGLVSTSRAGLNGGYRVRKFVIPDLKAMAAAARRAGAGLAVQSAYRSYETQAATFNYWVQTSGRRQALLSSARPGHSEHQLGTTIDFRSANSTRAPWNYADWGKTRPGRWLANNAWKYGFVMSYPRYKRAVTCYKYEPWHYRYVGRERAAQIRESGLTSREYLWENFESVSQE